MRFSKINKYILSILIIVTVSVAILGTIKANATTQDKINFETMPKAETEQTIRSIVGVIVSNDASWIDNNYMYFTSPCFDKIKAYASNNNIIGDVISEVVVDFTYPENSTTGDTVIMANTRVWANGNTVNCVYLFEFHVNSEGLIYGYNVWAY